MPSPEECREKCLDEVKDEYSDCLEEECTYAGWCALWECRKNAQKCLEAAGGADNILENVAAGLECLGEAKECYDNIEKCEKKYNRCVVENYQKCHERAKEKFAECCKECMSEG